VLNFSVRGYHDDDDGCDSKSNMDPVALHNKNQISGLLWQVGAILMNTENDDPTDSPNTGELVN